MKILMIQPTGDKFGHYGANFCNTAQELAKLGHNVTIYTNSLKTDLFIEADPLFKVFLYKKGSFKFKPYEVNKNKNSLTYWYNYFIFSFVITYNGLKFAAEKKFEKVYISDSEFLMASIALFLTRKKSLSVLMQVNASNFSFKEYPGSFLKKLYKTFQATIFSLATKRYINAFSILGQWHEDRLRRQLNLNDRYPIYHIPDGASSNKKIIRKSFARKRLNLHLEKNQKLFLFNGILRNDKGLECLSSAIYKLTNLRSDFFVLISGHPYDYSKDDVKKMFSVFGNLLKNVRLDLKYIDEKLLPYYFYSADAFILPYNKKYKGSTGPLTKGVFTYNLPAIVSNLGEMGFLAKNNELGFTFTPENVDELVDAFIKFLETDSNKIKNFKNNASRLRKKHSWENVAKTFEFVFSQI